MIVCGLAAPSGTGKTTLLEQLVAHLRARGHTVATIKHTHHDIDPDPPGKDTWRHRRAGAVRTLLVGPARWTLTGEHPHAPPPPLAEQLRLLAGADIVLIEGDKHGPHPKIELHRPETGHPPLWPNDPHILALAAPTPQPDCPLPQLSLNDPAAIADFILHLPPYHTQP